MCFLFSDSDHSKFIKVLLVVAQFNFEILLLTFNNKHPMESANFEIDALSIAELSTCIMKDLSTRSLLYATFSYI